MRNAKSAFELKIKVVKEYEAGNSTIRSLPAEYGMSHKSAEDWIRKYHEQGEVGLMIRRFWGINKSEMYYLQIFDNENKLRSAFEEYIHFCNCELFQEHLKIVLQ